MKTKMFALFLLAAMFVTQVPPALAQGGLHDWGAVQAIATNSRLVVKQKDGGTVEGEMIEANATNLSISRNNKVMNIARDNIREIYVSKGKAAKGKWAAIGAGVGAGAGAGIGATKYSADRDDSGIYVTFGLLLGAGIGALSGFAFGASRRSRELVYTAP
jgi:hypothetical protein